MVAIKSWVEINVKNPIDEYFANQMGKEVLTSKELFKADEIDLRSELTWREVTLINILHYYNMLLKKRGFKSTWDKYLEHYMRFKVSKDRGSRHEFVDMNKAKDDVASATSLASNISNIMGAKK